jgi:hypothetical protein
MLALSKDRLVCEVIREILDLLVPLDRVDPPDRVDLLDLVDLLAPLDLKARLVRKDARGNQARKAIRAIRETREIVDHKECPERLGRQSV